MFDLVFDNLRIIGTVVSGTVVAASAICAATETPKDDQRLETFNAWWPKIYKIIEILALNFGKAKR